VDTPGFQADADGVAEETIMEIASAAVVVLVFSPGLAQGDRTDLIRTLYGDRAQGIPGKSAQTLLVINRADELGADPETGDEFAVLCAHKSAELRESLAIPGHGFPPGHVVCIAADPYGTGQAQPWDGMAEFARALKAAGRDFARNATDMTILAGGLSRISALNQRLARDLLPLRERADELRSLERDLGAMLAEAEELNLERRAALRHDISGLIDGLISRTLTERNADKRHAAVRRLETLSETVEFQQIIQTWSGEAERKAATLEQEVGHRIGRRLGDREPESAVPELKLSQDARVLERAVAGMGIGTGIAKAGSALQKLERFTAGAAGTSRFGRFVSIGGPMLTVAGAGYSAWSLIGDVRRDAARERKRTETIRAIQDQGAKWAAEIADRDGTLARLAELTGLIRDAQDGAADESQLTESAAWDVDARIARYRMLANEAAELLGIDKKGTP